MEASEPLALAVIPARGGSKGIPGKNLREVGGQPLVARAVAAARAARRVGRVVVSTDDAAIAAVARAAGAEIAWRPESLARDETSTEAVLLDLLDGLERAGQVPELLLLLQCTSPLTTAAEVDGTLDKMLSTGADSALTVSPIHAFLWCHDAEGRAVGVNHDWRQRPRRQDRRAEFVETGAVYAMRTAGFRAARHRFFGKVALHVAPRSRWLEVDEPGDLQVAAALLDAAPPQPLPADVAAVVFDFDGVFTDNRVLVGADGSEMVTCSRADGLGLSRLRSLGLPLLVLSGEKHPVAAARCAKLGLECRAGVDEKLPVLQAWAAERGIDLARVVYVGNDTNDVTCLRAVGWGIVVADAHPAAAAAARIRLEHRGGHGAVRELCDRIEAGRETRE